MLKASFLKFCFLEIEVSFISFITESELYNVLASKLEHLGNHVQFRIDIYFTLILSTSCQVTHLSRQSISNAQGGNS